MIENKTERKSVGARRGRLWVRRFSTQESPRSCRLKGLESGGENPLRLAGEESKKVHTSWERELSDLQNGSVRAWIWSFHSQAAHTM